MPIIKRSVAVIALLVLTVSVVDWSESGLACFASNRDGCAPVVQFADGNIGSISTSTSEAAELNKKIRR
ncbi:MAG TPA: hypothetical protein VHP99_16570, partial [Pyrinomonadaceae bacterium]|nr:hypothetical protein [Pyrinomonadaceae bacterium]